VTIAEPPELPVVSLVTIEHRSTIDIFKTHNVIAVPIETVRHFKDPGWLVQCDQGVWNAWLDCNGLAQVKIQILIPELHTNGMVESEKRLAPKDVVMQTRTLSAREMKYSRRWSS
jgi:hypothetical protein